MAVIRALIAATVAACGATQTVAEIVGGEILRQDGNGRFVELEASEPFSVGYDTFDDDNLYAFNEDQNIALSSPVRVDVGDEDGVIPQGTVVASHYVFFDSLSGTHYGYVDFDAAILGIAAFEQSLAATDWLANNAVTYISIELRGLERGDQVWIDEDKPNRLWVYWAGSSPGDYIRVFTARSGGPLLG